jgi:predicted ABC-type ATPase
MIAGPNGAGKTTFFAPFSHRLPVVNPDVIARRMAPEHQGEPSVMLKAGRQAIHDRNAHLAAGRSFAIETTLTGNGEIDLLRRARAAGYKVTLLYLGLDSAETSYSRVAQRVREGGHGVPAADIGRRYARSLHNLTLVLPLLHRLYVVDTVARNPRLLLIREDARIKYISPNPPDWSRPILDQAGERRQN